MTYQFTAALVRSLGGRVREVRLDQIVEGAYAATVSVEGPQGVALVDARSSDALADGVSDVGVSQELRSRSCA